MKKCMNCGKEYKEKGYKYCPNCSESIIQIFRAKVCKDKRLKMSDILSDYSFKFNFITEIGRF